MNPTDLIDAENLRDDVPVFAPGDTLKVHVRVVEGNKVTEADQHAKLELVVEIARKAWGRWWEWRGLGAAQVSDRPFKTGAAGPDRDPVLPRHRCDHERGRRPGHD